MKALLAVCVVGILVAMAAGVTIRWQPGMNYLYSMKSKVIMSGANGDSTHERHALLEGEVLLSCVSKASETGPYEIEMTLHKMAFLDKDRMAAGEGNGAQDAFQQAPAIFWQKSDGTISDFEVSDDEHPYVVVVKKAIVSAFQTRTVNGGLHSTSVREAVGVHNMRYAMAGEDTIVGVFDHTDFAAFPKSQKMTGSTVHVIPAASQIIEKATVTHRVNFLKGQVLQEETGDLVKSDSEISSVGEIILTLIRRERRTRPRIPTLSNYHSVSLSTTKEELRQAVVATDAEDSYVSVQPLVDDLLTNPQQKPFQQLAESAHHLLTWMWQHPTHRDVIVGELKKMTLPFEPKLVQFVIDYADHPETDEPSTSTPSVTPAYDDPSYPHSKSKDWNLDIGPHDVCLKLSAGYFLGTNFDCTHEHLNYKVEGHASATGNFFGHSQNVIDVEAIYAATAGATSANRLFVKVWNSVIKDAPLIPVSTGPCPAETVEKIWSASPGLHYGITVMVGPVPITFSVGVTVNLDLSWGHLVCLQDLRAQIDLQPSITVVASAGASVSIFIARAGIDIAGSVNQKIVPAAWINGNLCQIGVDLRRKSDPMSIKFEGWWETRGCHIHHWHISCGWGGRHSHTFWHWDSSSVNQLLWGEVCQAKLNPWSLTCGPEH